MKSCAIYYPYIEVPQSPWFTRVLLYWDEVGAIVPYEYLDDPDRLGKHMVGLVREGLVRQVIPGMHLWKVANFSDAFIDYVDEKNRPQKPYNWAKIHMEKLQGIAEKLCERGLAQRDRKNRYSPWYRVESRTANKFMAYLAAVLGQLADDDKFYPITDQENRLDPFISESPEYLRRLPLRKLTLERILPAPSRAIEPAQLADFKEYYKPELQRFRREIEDKISELSVIEDDDSRDIRLNDIVKNMQETLREITKRMEEQRNWPRLNFGTLCTIVGSGISAWKAIINQDWKFGLVGAALSLAPAVYNAFRGSNVNFEDKPLAYAALAGRELGKSG
ncbi:MAG: DUF6236 family protein [Syntrophales bacterium]|nr:DUF6236 family protein [Syntrophales bacterium]